MGVDTSGKLDNGQVMQGLLCSNEVFGGFPSVGPFSSECGPWTTRNRSVTSALFGKLLGKFPGSAPYSGQRSSNLSFNKFSR